MLKQLEFLRSSDLSLSAVCQQFGCGSQGLKRGRRLWRVARFSIRNSPGSFTFQKPAANLGLLDRWASFFYLQQLEDLQ